jgi:hypothetical protein
MTHSLGLAVALVLLALPACVFAAAPARITVEAGPHERVDTPLRVPCPAGITPDMLMQETTDGRKAPVWFQIEADEPRHLCFILSGKTPAGAVRTFALAPTNARRAVDSAVTAKADETLIEVSVGGKAVLRYHRTEEAPPEGVDPKFRRGAYIYPAWTPSGLDTTDNYPPDHPHQRGIWMSWTKTEFGDLHPDFWNLGGATGAIRPAASEPMPSGPVFGGFTAKHRWVAIKGDEDKPVLDEQWTVRVWNTAGAAATAWLWDLESTQTCSTDTPLKLPKYYYGGLGYRGNREWIKAVAFLTSEGKTRKDGNESKARWTDTSGVLDGRAAGVLILGHPQNFRAPEPMRLNPQQPQICFAPSQEGEWSIEPGAPRVWRYRFVVHDGPVAAAEADRLWNDFAHPPTVKFE